LTLFLFTLIEETLTRILFGMTDLQPHLMKNKTHRPLLLYSVREMYTVVWSSSRLSCRFKWHLWRSDVLFTLHE